MYRRWLTACVFLFVAVLLGACNSGDTAAPAVSPTPSAVRQSRTPRATGTPGPTPELAPPAPTAIINGTLVDGTGADGIEDAYVLIREGRIEAAGCCASQLRIPSGYEIIDAGGGTIMPGLIDGHVHITRAVINPDLVRFTTRVDEDALVPFVQAGFTTLRDVGTATVIMQSMKFLTDRLEKQQRKSPHIVWAGPLITAVGGYPISVPRYAAGGQEVRSAEEAVALVDSLADQGARIIKLGLEKGYYADEGWPLLSLDEVRAIADRAHERGLLVTAHVTSLDEVRLALDGGVDNLAHTPLESLTDELIAEMLRKGMGIVSTATIWNPDGAQIAAENVKRFADAGGVVSIGTDFGCCDQVAGVEPYLYEMQFLQQAGMTPMQLIVAATRNGALLANAGDATGSVEVGKEADIVILDGDPLADVNALRVVRIVIQDGRVVYERGGEVSTAGAAASPAAARPPPLLSRRARLPGALRPPAPP